MATSDSRSGPLVRLAAPIDARDGIARRIRVLGDESRGYLLAGAPEVTDGDAAVWFETLEDMFQHAEALGVPRICWEPIQDALARGDIGIGGTDR